MGCALVAVATTAKRLERAEEKRRSLRRRPSVSVLAYRLPDLTVAQRLWPARAGVD